MVDADCSSRRRWRCNQSLLVNLVLFRNYRSESRRIDRADAAACRDT